MNFPLYIAKRYLFSKKSTNAINVISVISVIGVAVATMALVIVLSVFNGFHDLVATFFTNFDPQLEVVPTQGKTAPSDDPLLAKMKALPAVDVATESVEDQALALYKGQQAMVIVKGVDDNFDQLTHVKDILFGDGTYSLHAGNLQYGIISSLIFSVLIIFFVNYKSDFFIALFNSENDAGLHASAKEGIAVYFWAFLFGGINTLLVSYFSATNNPKPAFLTSLIRGTFAIIFFALLLSSIWKMLGVWLAFPCSEAFSFLVILYYYQKEQKENGRLKI